LKGNLKRMKLLKCKFSINKLMVLLDFKIFNIVYNVFIIKKCRNPSFGLVTKARGCKVTGQEKDSRVTSHAPMNVKNVRE
jgi:hypothetical protein